MSTPWHDVLRDNQTDRERLLLSVIRLLRSAAMRAQPPNGRYTDPHIAFYRRAQVGDLAIGMSGEIGWIKAITETEDDIVYSVKELGRDRLVNWHNEIFHPIIGADLNDFLEGEQRRFQEFAMDAINTGAHGYVFSYAGVKFQNIPEDFSVTVRLRQRHFQKWYQIEIEDYRVFISGENGKERFQQFLLENGWTDKSLYKEE